MSVNRFSRRCLAGLLSEPTKFLVLRMVRRDGWRSDSVSPPCSCAVVDHWRRVEDEVRLHLKRRLIVPVTVTFSVSVHGCVISSGVNAFNAWIAYFECMNHMAVGNCLLHESELQRHKRNREECECEFL